jgi:uncharacterized protein
LRKSILGNTVSLLPGLEAHPSGALWIPQSGTALVADVHLGYSWAQRRRGELGPLADARTREKLLNLFDDLRPSRVVFLGDLVHAPRPCVPERDWIEATLRELSGRAELISVRGNHDRAFAREFGHLPVATVEQWSTEAILAVHGDRPAALPLPETQTLVIGHLHPCLGIRDAAGASQKVPVFLSSGRCLILPAFSPFARGFDISCGLPPELEYCFGGQTAEVFAATSRRVARLGPLRQTVQRMWQADVSAPAQFRRKVHHE